MVPSQCLSPITQVYKWEPANLMLGGNSAMHKNPNQGMMMTTRTTMAIMMMMMIECIGPDKKGVNTHVLHQANYSAATITGGGTVA